MQQIWRLSLRFQVSNKIHTLPHVCDFIGQITDLISICLFLHLSNFCQEISHAAEFQSISNASWMHLHFAFLRPNSYLICLRFMKWWSVNGVKRNQYMECIWPSPDHFMMNTAVFMFLGLSVASMICYTIFYKTLITFGTVYDIFFFCLNCEILSFPRHLERRLYAHQGWFMVRAITWYENRSLMA